MADRLGREIRIAHYPPYCSKYNPIERRLFPHVTRACQGVIFDSVATVKRLLEKTRTATGLGVVVEVVEKVYQTGRKYAEGFKKGNRSVPRLASLLLASAKKSLKSLRPFLGSGALSEYERSVCDPWDLLS